MAVNRDKPDLWKDDIAQSVDFYNNWFMLFAPKAFRKTRVDTTKQVEKALKLTCNFNNIHPDILLQYPYVLPTLRMCTCPPIARDRLIGLAKVPHSLVMNMEVKHRIPPQMEKKELIKHLIASFCCGKLFWTEVQ